MLAASWFSCISQLLHAARIELLSVLALTVGAVAVLLPVKQSADFMQRWLGDVTLQKSVQAVLVDDTGTHKRQSD
jgi:hypothetical protein